jgi:hypothetical protein
MKFTRISFQSISRMLDLGGMPSMISSNSPNSLRIDLSKNCRLRCVAFDFQILAKGDEDNHENFTKNDETNVTQSLQEISSKPITPDVSRIQEIANIMKVQLGGFIGSNHSNADNMTKILDLHPPLDVPIPVQQNDKSTISNFPLTDIRDKYAARLRTRVHGDSLAALDRAKAEVSSVRGDGLAHSAARAIAIQQEINRAPSNNWIARNGTASILHYIISRSLNLALLPSCTPIDGDRNNFLQQMPPQLKFHTVIQEGTNESEYLDTLLRNVSMEPQVFMVISNRDAYLRRAKELGMISCRIRSNFNGPRGAVTAHHTLSSLSEVQDVIQEWNGVSYARK